MVHPICRYKYTGEMIPEEQLPWKNERYRPNQLLEACFVPAPVDTYPDRPQSPVPEGADAAAVAAAAQAESVTKPAVARYAPPSARNGGGSNLAERMRKEKEGQVIGATAITAKVLATTLAVKKSSIPGMAAPVAPAAGGGKSKSQLKREKMKKQKEQQQQHPPMVEVPEPAHLPPSAEPAPESATATDDAAKRARKIKKLLKQIDDLKEKIKHDNSSTLINDDQKAKLDSEVSLRAELATLE
jgi:translation initiation factor 2A